MNTAPGSTDVVATVAVARANWPHDPSSGSEAVWVNWAQKLGPYGFDEVRAALDDLVLTHSRLPSLAEIIRALKEQRRALAEAERARVVPLPRHVDRSLAERLRSMDRAAHDWRQEARAEYLAFAHRHHVDGAEAERELRALDEDGPFARRARELVAGNVEPGVGIDAMLRSFAEEAQADDERVHTKPPRSA
jgi:hypothetical protein